MENYNSLLELSVKSDMEIDNYLEDVSTEQFRQDIIELSKMNVDKHLIQMTIEKLQKLL